MDNYKIKVKDEAESKEAQELFFELGYEWNGTGKQYFYVTSGQILAYSTGVLFQIGDESGQELTLSELRALALANQPQDPALISSADALRALADGKSVEWEDENGAWWSVGAAWTWNQILNMSGIKSLRLKPQTTKLELELPKPFEPQMGDRYWIIHPAFKRGYTEGMFGEADKHEAFQQFGAYRTEDDVKKAVEQLRKIRGTNS